MLPEPGKHTPPTPGLPEPDPSETAGDPCVSVFAHFSEQRAGAHGVVSGFRDEMGSVTPDMTHTALRGCEAVQI